VALAIVFQEDINYHQMQMWRKCSMK